MTLKELAAMLNGREYRSEMTSEEEQAAKESGLVVVFGASDDLCELRGAINDESDCFDGGTVYLTKDGILNPPGGECQDIGCPYYKAAMQNAKSFHAIWCGGGVFPWEYKTDIPHETFDIFEDGEPYCRGIVFDLAALHAGEGEG